MLQHFVTEMPKGSGGFCLVHGSTWELVCIAVIWETLPG